MNGRQLVLAVLGLGWLLAIGVYVDAAPAGAATTPSGQTITPIKHFLFLMQGDRSFDNYFGTYPGADGIPAAACQVYLAGDSPGGCVKPFDLHGNSVPPLGATSAEVIKQYDKGQLDAFVSALQSAGRDGTKVMGHYDQRDLPTAWRAAQNYVLFDRFFSSTMAGERSNRSYWVSGAGTSSTAPAVGPTTIFDRLQAAGITWKFYVENYVPKDNFRGRSQTATNTQTARVPLINYARFVDDPALSSHIVDLSQYYSDLRNGTLPAVAYLASSGANERSGRSIPAGQKLISSLTGQLMLSKYWKSSAFLWSYDGSGGWYDHVNPPQVDGAGYGLRVPALLVSPYAKRGAVIHTALDYTSGLAFIEHNWRIAPLAARDAGAMPLTGAFDFGSPARSPVLLSVDPKTAAPPPLASMKIVYLSYGGAMLLVLASICLATVRSARRTIAPVVKSPDLARVGADAL